jgi:hypothetical protein
MAKKVAHTMAVDKKSLNNITNLAFKGLASTRDALRELQPYFCRGVNASFTMVTFSWVGRFDSDC